MASQLELPLEVTNPSRTQVKKTAILPTPSEIVAYLDRFVRGQSQAKRDLAVAVYNHYISLALLDANVEKDLGRHHILLLGPTGCGKTYLVKTLAERLGVPVLFASATSLVETGYKGRSVDDLIRSLLERADGNVKLAESGIIFIDEIDKIRKCDSGGSRDVNGEGVQNALLTILDGRIADSVDMQSHPPVNTAKVLFICTGAFVGLPAIVEDRLGGKRRPIGFNFPTPEDDLTLRQPVFRALSQVQTVDFVGFGMIPEFLGRFSTITALHELEKTDLRAILTSVEASAFTKQKSFARIHGIDLEITEDALDAIAAKAFEMGTGARGLHRLLGKAIGPVAYCWSELADQGISKVVIDRSCIVDRAEPKLVAGPPACSRIDLFLRQTFLSFVSASTESSSTN